MKYATLKNIASYLNIPLSSGRSENRRLALLFLPDIIEPDLLDKSMNVKGWSPKALGYLVRGNYNEYNQILEKNGEEIAGAAEGFSDKDNTQALRDAIKRNTSIKYKDNLGVISCREDMWKKIDYLVARTNPQKLRELFTELEILPFLDDTTLEEVKTVLNKLISTENYTYALFLLVLTAVFRGDVKELEFLYSSEEIKKVLLSRGARSMLPEDCIYFSDKNYMDREYQVFLYRKLRDEDELFKKGILTLDSSGKIPKAKLLLEDDHIEICRHLYEGSPMLTGNTVYIPMGDTTNKNSLGILCFEYENFTNNMPMYFRSGLFLSSNYRYKTPQVQKVVITLKERDKMSDVDKIAIKGQLRTSGTNIIFTKEELQEFCDNPDIKREDWFPKFEKYILPNLLSREYTNCCITEEDIRRFPKGRFTSQELTKISFVFKDFAESHWQKKNTYITCEVPEDFHYLVREDD